MASSSLAPKLAAALTMFLIFLGTRNSKASEMASAPRYQFAIGGDVAAGGQGYDPEEIAGLAEVNFRWQCLPALGLGASFGSLGLGTRPKDLQAAVLGVHLSLHPLGGSVNSHFDPYLRLGPLYFAHVGGDLQYVPSYEVTRLGLEGVLGMNFAWQHFAFGPEIRIGRTNQAWEMFGLHLEARL